MHMCSFDFICLKTSLYLSGIIYFLAFFYLYAMFIHVLTCHLLYKKIFQCMILKFSLELFTISS